MIIRLNLENNRFKLIEKNQVKYMRFCLDKVMLL